MFKAEERNSPPERLPLVQPDCLHMPPSPSWSGCKASLFANRCIWSQLVSTSSDFFDAKPLMQNCERSSDVQAYSCEGQLMRCISHAARTWGSCNNCFIALGPRCFNLQSVASLTLWIWTVTTISTIKSQHLENDRCPEASLDALKSLSAVKARALGKQSTLRIFEILWGMRENKGGRDFFPNAQGATWKWNEMD